MPVLTERRGRVLLIRLDRDAKLNAMDHAMTLGLDAAMNLLQDDAELWAGVLSGNGRAFSAGSDLADPDRNHTERGGLYGLIRRKPLDRPDPGLERVAKANRFSPHAGECPQSGAGVADRVG